jgi:carboxyl-terminal processing protease
MTFKTRLSVLLLSTPILAFVLIGGLLGNNAAATQDGQIRPLSIFDDVLRLVLGNYVEEVKIDRAMEGALRGLAEGLDPDSAYLTAEQVKALEAGAVAGEGEIGVELTRQYYLRVIAARDGSPAAAAGLQTGDYVRAIDGRATRDMSVYEGTRMLRGKPGTAVTLTIIRGNAAEPHEVKVERAKAQLPAVTSRMLDQDIAYLRIPVFAADTAAQVRQQAADLTGKGARAVVIDLRRTAEGNIEHGIAAAKLFVASGTITAKAGRAAKDAKEAPKETIAAAPGDGAIKLPVQLLMSAGTSGAAEVFAAALKGNKRADLIGEHTIGRAAAQKLVKLPEGRGLWLTYARYQTPSGEPIHGAGLKPDVPFDEPDVEFGTTLPQSDPMLAAALAHAKKILTLKMP